MTSYLSITETLFKESLILHTAFPLNFFLTSSPTMEAQFSHARELTRALQFALWLGDYYPSSGMEFAPNSNALEPAFQFEAPKDPEHLGRSLH